MHRIQRFLKHLVEAQWLEQIELEQWTIEQARYVTVGHYEILSPRTVSDRTLQGTHGITYKLETNVTIPPAWSQQAVAILFDAGGGEGLMQLNGEHYHGLDRNHTFVPLRTSHIGQPLTIEIELYDPIPEPHDPLNGQPEFVAPLVGFTASIVRVNASLRSLMHSVRLLTDAAQRLPEGELRRSEIVRALEECMHTAYDLPQASWQIEQPWAQLQQLLRERVGQYAPTADTNGRMIMVGQSHIDIAWLWPIRETVRKTSRTFSTMCTLLEQYPEFVYTQSQPQLFAYVKEHYPELYAKIKQYVAQGRWELVGGMWVEPDLNIPSGESLARQLLYGQRFYRAEFQQTSSIEWLPDTFGYAASLPQLLRQAEIDYFMTTKLNWNDTNVFPYDLFQWVGIDGTPVLSYLNHGVNESTTVKDIAEHWQSFRQKDIHPEQMLLYGHGDGGGGVTERMVEYVQHAEWMIGQPQAEFGTAKQFFDHVQQCEYELPIWRGDLYLELHRGTYTTQAWNKRYNRKAEILYREAEVWERLAQLQLGTSSLATTDTGVDPDHIAIAKSNHTAHSKPIATTVEQANDDSAIPIDQLSTLTTAQPYTVSGQAAAHNQQAASYSVSPLLLHRAKDADQQPITAELFKQGWLGIMLNQFHDIVPGSAIHEVYRTSDVEYAEILRIGQAALDQALHVWTESIAHTYLHKHSDGNAQAGTAYIVFNSFGWERGDWVEIRGGDELHGLAAFDEHGQALASDVIVLELAEPQPEPNPVPFTPLGIALPKLPGFTTWTDSLASKQTGAYDVNNNNNNNNNNNTNTNTNNSTSISTNAKAKPDEFDRTAGNVANDSSADQSIANRARMDSSAIDSAAEPAFTLRIHVPSIPAFGYTIIWLREADHIERSALPLHEYEHADDVCSPADIVLGAAVPTVWETPFYTIRFNEQGELESLYDKQYAREVFKPGHAGNTFGYYHDRPTLWDAWDIDPQFAAQSAGRAHLLFSQVVMRGRTGDILRFRWEVGASIITQDMYLYTAHRRIDFRTTVDWQESHKLLKVNFPVELVAEQATYEIPFGALERMMHNNTSWERAQFEVCGHRWADVSEGDYGVSLLNDCKYGYDIKDGHMRLSLLRAPKWPDHAADIGMHEFTYALLPHGGNWRDAHTVRAAAELNQPVPVRSMVNDSALTPNIANIHNAIHTPNAANTPNAQHAHLAFQSASVASTYGVSLLHYDSRHVVLDTIKPVEDGDGTIFRLYESSGSRGKAVLAIVSANGQHLDGQWLLTNLLEDEQQHLPAQAGRLELIFKPYEIKTLKWKGSESI
ncbi:alpha-mannosidase [Paenibacillus sp. SGZ-1009]|uniref:alpha-mannosidase n=1 Tax=Paenibacillus campi TaxID=3106031 RepID=UPI002AFE7185|nr:glycoside hydrolase family 38 C-terminal domain-containing protein [Paenibacillus sp. SGZ-1009]